MLESFAPQLRVDSVPLEHFKGGADVVIASKTITKSKDATRSLRGFFRAGSKILFDLVDGNPRSSRHFDRFIWAYLCSSRSEKTYRDERGQRAFYVPQHVDLRLHSSEHVRDKFILGYSGAPRNALHLDSLPVNIFDSGRSQQGSELAELNNFLSSLSHHYSVRQYERDGFKPGLKIFIASMFGGAFLGSQEDPETFALLGDRYPYLSEDSTLANVSATIKLAKSTFGDELHAEALRQMETLRSEYCPARIARDLHTTVKDAMEDRS